MPRLRPTTLGELELAVLDHLWTVGGREVKDVHLAIGVPRGITLNTIQSTLKRLFDKQLLEREKVGHAHVYSPRTTREEFHRQALLDVVEGLMGGERTALYSAFLDLAERVGRSELDRLERLILLRRGEQREDHGEEHR